MTNPDDDLSWPLYIGYLPDGADKGVVYDTAGEVERRDMRGGGCTHYGVRLVIKAYAYTEAWDLLETIIADLKHVHKFNVVFGSLTYTVFAITRRSSITYRGKIFDTTELYGFSVDFVMSLSDYAIL